MPDSSNLEYCSLCDFLDLPTKDPSELNTGAIIERLQESGGDISDEAFFRFMEEGNQLVKEGGYRVMFGGKSLMERTFPTRLADKIKKEDRLAIIQGLLKTTIAYASGKFEPVIKGIYNNYLENVREGDKTAKVLYHELASDLLKRFPYLLQ